MRGTMVYTWAMVCAFALSVRGRTVAADQIKLAPGPRRYRGQRLYLVRY